MKNKKAFTLVELLAIIVILAVILAVAIPNVVTVINSSRENAFKRSAGLILRQAKKEIVNNPAFVPGTTANQYRLIPLSSVNFDANVDPWGDTYNRALSYVLAIRNSTGGITYAIFLCSDNVAPRRRVMGTLTLRGVVESSIDARPIVTTTATCPALPTTANLTAGTIEGHAAALID